MKKDFKLTKIKEFSEIKTVDFQINVYLNNIYGNPYNVTIAILNYGMDNEERIKLPESYGSASQGEYDAKEAIFKAFDMNYTSNRHRLNYKNDDGIIIRRVINEVSFKRLKELAKAEF